MKKLIYGIFLLINLLSTSCNKPPISQTQIYECNHKDSWDSLSIANYLVGEWEWQYVSCFWSPEDANCKDFKGLVVHFKADGTLEVNDNGQVLQNSNWTLKKEDGNLLGIETTPMVSQLEGRILFCKEELEFNNSYIDGCDNYFKKM